MNTHHKSRQSSFTIDAYTVNWDVHHPVQKRNKVSGCHGGLQNRHDSSQFLAGWWQLQRSGAASQRSGCFILGQLPTRQTAFSSVFCEKLKAYKKNVAKKTTRPKIKCATADEAWRLQDQSITEKIRRRKDTQSDAQCGKGELPLETVFNGTWRLLEESSRNQNRRFATLCALVEVLNESLRFQEKRLWDELRRALNEIVNAKNIVVFTENVARSELSCAFVCAVIRGAYLFHAPTELTGITCQ